MNTRFCAWNPTLCAALLLIPIPAAAQSVQPQEQQGLFGTKNEIPFSLKGDIYFLPDNASQLPDFSKLKPVFSIHTTELNIPKTRFDRGFPGVTRRFEWFAIDYHGDLLIPEAGEYRFRLTSDDGSRLYIDRKQLIDNEGIHPATTKGGSIDLSKGSHKVRLSYFQAPPYYVALILEIAEREGVYHTLKTKAFAATPTLPPTNASPVPAQQPIAHLLEQTCHVDVYGIHFDLDSYQLRPEPEPVLREIAGVLKSRPALKLYVIGHTDHIGGEAFNLKLSEQRAAAVKAASVSRYQIVPSRLNIRGFGLTRPVDTNATEAGRARNRRVELTCQ